VVLVFFAVSDLILNPNDLSVIQDFSIDKNMSKFDLIRKRNECPLDLLFGSEKVYNQKISEKQVLITDNIYK